MSSGGTVETGKKEKKEEKNDENVWCPRHDGESGGNRFGEVGSGFGMQSVCVNMYCLFLKSVVLLVAGDGQIAKVGHEGNDS
jgi:hypothetical protein